MTKSKRILLTIGIVAFVVVGAQGVSAQSWSESTYYPLTKLSSVEYWDVSYMSPGSVMVVPPNANHWWSQIKKYSSAESALSGSDVKTVVLAGVGSSARGTAAMARLVAENIGEPVAGIVTGYGDYSTVGDATEGYFTARTKNQSGDWYSNDASQKLKDLVNDGAQIERIVGHSKGTFDAQNAMYQVSSGDRNGITFISFGLVAFYPDGYDGIRQYLGTSDTLGETNSENTGDSSHIPVSGKGHSLNYVMSMHLPVSGRLHLE